MRLAVVLFNLGGPDSLDAVEPYLRNLFSDPAIIRLPAPLRLPLAWLIARRRAPFARDIYEKLGGRSPILENTQAQARALEQALAAQGVDAKAFIAMRCWHPFSDETVAAVKAFAPERIVLLPLYPQYSTTTTASSFADWNRAAASLGIPTARVDNYPTAPGFIAALADCVRETWKQTRPGIRYRLLLSAHGLPERVIRAGDPYQRQVETTAAALVRELGMAELDPTVCYQSRVGPLTWIGPSTDSEIVRAGRDGMGVVVAPVAFVSEHSETLVELDMEYAKLARASGVPDYLRAPTVGTRAAFIDALARLVLEQVKR
ncbi:MAG TPA: ferrochelatase [Rhizomicrobium sp.]|nr:ferrochelatase [Rhizomicrobium sp.]